MNARIYVAAPLAQAPRARTIAMRLVAAGHSVESSWHVSQHETSDPTDPETRRILLNLNFAELSRANLVVAYLAGAELPRTTFAEVGFAYALKIPVVMALPPGPHANRCLLDSHELCTVYTSDELLEGVVAGLVAARKRANGGEFLCPKCGGSSFRTISLLTGPAETLERACKGKRIQEGRTYHYERCDFTWLGADDEKYGLVNHGSGS